MKDLTDILNLQGEKGSALVIGIVFLLVLTFLGLVGMQGSILEERMAGNARDREVAFRAAEAALRDGERFLTAAALPPFNGANGLYQPPAIGANPWWRALGDWDDPDDSRVILGALEGVAAQPLYIIEELPPVPIEGESEKFGALPEPELYRITARGMGGTMNAVVILQSTYRR